MLEDSPQSDLHLRILLEYGGQTGVRGKLLDGAPELVVEVCVSSTSYDLHQKYDLYAEAGVLDYFAIVVADDEIRWHQRRPNGFRRLPVPKDGIWRSRVFPGLCLNGNAPLAENMPEVIASLEKGLKSPEHEAFVKQLAARKAR